MGISKVRFLLSNKENENPMEIEISDNSVKFDLYIRWRGDYVFRSASGILAYRYTFTLSNIYFRSPEDFAESRLVIKNLSVPGNNPSYNDRRIFCEKIEKAECEKMAKNEPRNTLDNIAFKLGLKNLLVI